jgi:hypothetical protein
VAEERPAPTNVVAAIARVMEDLPPIGKDMTVSTGKGSYKARGIEAITAACQKLMGKYGVVMIPRTIKRDVAEITVNGNAWTEDYVEVEYDVYGPGGIEDHIVLGPVPGLGRDSSDKGSNKAMTGAYKVALLQAFCVADSKDDPDAERHESEGGRAQRRSAPSNGAVSAPPARQPEDDGPRLARKSQWAKLAAVYKGLTQEQVASLGADLNGKVNDLYDEKGEPLATVTESEIQAVIDTVQGAVPGEQEALPV